MAREQVGYDPRPEALATTVAPNFQMVQPQSAEVIQSGNNAYRLAEALGSGVLQLQKWNEEQAKLKTESQMRKVPYYADLFKQEMPEGGAVSQSQVGARFPETVGVVAARIAEIMGGNEAEKHTAAINEHILSDDALKMDTDARAAYIDQQRQEHMSQYALGGKQNDFFTSGYITAFDNGMNQYHGQYLQATAQFHQKIQADDFVKKIRGLVDLGQEHMLTGLDTAWNASSSLNHLARNKLLIDTFIDIAKARGSEELLDRVPARFLSAEASENIAGAKQQIVQIKRANFAFEQTVLAANEKAFIQDGKRAILQDSIDGKAIVAKNYNNPELFQYALLIRETPPIATIDSAAAKALMTSKFFTAATFEDSIGQEAINKEILNHRGMNPNDKVALLEAVPKLMEGYQALRDPMVMEMLNARINPRLVPLETSPTSKLSGMLVGRSLRTEVTTAFRAALALDFKAHWVEFHELPTGKVKAEMIEKQVARAELDVAEKLKIENLQAYIVERAKTEAAATKKPPPVDTKKPPPVDTKKPPPVDTKKPTPVDTKKPAVPTGKKPVLNTDGTPILFNGEIVYKYD